MRGVIIPMLCGGDVERDRRAGTHFSTCKTAERKRLVAEWVEDGQDGQDGQPSRILIPGIEHCHLTSLQCLKRLQSAAPEAK